MAAVLENQTFGEVLSLAGIRANLRTPDTDANVDQNGAVAGGNASGGVTTPTGTPGSVSSAQTSTPAAPPADDTVDDYFIPGSTNAGRSPTPASSSLPATGLVRPGSSEPAPIDEANRELKEFLATPVGAVNSQAADEVRMSAWNELILAANEANSPVVFTDERGTVLQYSQVQQLLHINEQLVTNIPAPQDVILDQIEAGIVRIFQPLIDGVSRIFGRGDEGGTAYSLAATANALNDALASTNAASVGVYQLSLGLQSQLLDQSSTLAVNA